MSSNTVNWKENFQPTDETDTRTAARNQLAKRIERKQREETLGTEAHVRKLLKDAETAIVERGDIDRSPEELLEELHLYLWHDPDWPDVSRTDGPPAPNNAYQFRQIHRRFETGDDIDLSMWYEVLADVAKGLGYLSSINDPTQYAPVYLEKLDPDEVPHAPDIDTVTPVGRRRIGADDATDPKQKEVVIPHDDCDHILAIAKPREGKDSTLTSIGMNLWHEHGYKYVSLHDDGRMETPMLAIPNDEQAIKDNLERFNQQPRAMDVEVFVPRMEGTPDVLPSNFEPFTLGIDMLTPKDILRLAGVTDSDPSLELRIKEALEITLNRSGQVDELINLLFDFAEGLEATIEWTEEQDKHKSDGSVETYTASFSLDAEKAVERAAQRLARLAGEGFIASPDAATNIDFHDLIARNEKAAVLCCNFIDASEGFKYTIMDLWLQKIMDVRDGGRLPRVCLEVRELKNVAPSQPQHARYKDQIRALQQTFRVIATQGSSRRVLLLGSTQKFNDVLRPVRNNMDTKIFLRQGQEQVRELDKMMDFTDNQKDQLRTFQTGWGMIYADGEPYLPIEWRGAPCGLGLGDQVWRDRYGKAWGARVRETGDVPWTDRTAPKWWADAVAGDVVDADRQPAIGGWYLLPDDFPEPIDSLEYEQARDVVSGRLIEWTLRNRRDHTIPSDLSLEPVSDEARQRDITLEQIGQETTYEDIASRHDVPRAISAWLKKDASTRQNYIRVCELVGENEFRRYDQIHDALDSEWSMSAFRNHASNDDSGLGMCLEKDGQLWTLTPVGKRVLDIDWGAVETGLREVDR